MKKISVALCGLAMLGLASCTTLGPVGGLYTGVTTGHGVTSNTLGTKVGTSSAIGVLGLIGVGNAGIQSAARDGGISKISHVDVKTTSVLGLFTQYTTIVYGE